jgi:hypothetical protein
MVGSAALKAPMNDFLGQAISIGPVMLGLAQPYWNLSSTKKLLPDSIL